MRWKPSKRQAQLKQRLIDSSRIYWSTSRQLDQMLLKMLHSNNVYTPDDLYNKYINKDHNENRPAKISQDQSSYNHSDGYEDHDDSNSTRKIDRVLTKLSLALIQLKDVIDKK